MKTLWKKFNEVGKVLDIFCPQKRDEMGSLLANTTFRDRKRDASDNEQSVNMVYGVEVEEKDTCTIEHSRGHTVDDHLDNRLIQIESANHEESRNISLLQNDGRIGSGVR